MTNPFWDFSLAFYADPEVQAACLVLQDQAGCDVNLVLYALYRARGGDTLDMDSLAALEAGVRPVREIAVAPLRAIRRHMKAEGLAADPDGFERLRNEVKTVELHAEKLMQSLLAQADPVTEPAEPAEAARSNLVAYGRIIGADPLPAPQVAVLLARLEQMG